jgi:MoaA/NifB/PqqE/SkfB family radical SAM enzyme
MKNIMNRKVFTRLVGILLAFAFLRKIMLKIILRRMYRILVEEDKENLHQIQIKKYQFLSALLLTMMKNLKKKYISAKVVLSFTQSMVDNYVNNPLHKQRTKAYREQYGEYPPKFIVLAPTKKCNLNCEGCYNSSENKRIPSLPFDIVNRIIQENEELFGSKFVVISGGEPFMYKEDGKTLMDIFRSHKDVFFQCYSNGTLIDNAIAKDLAALGNVSIAISLEGFEKETDERRGKGVYQKIMQTLENFRNAGLPFGISATISSKNQELMLKEDFYDFCFQEQGASYLWLFQFHPIGKGKDIYNLMVKPEFRFQLLKLWDYLLSEKKYCIADFWNSGTVSDGCIAYGRKGGYVYINPEGHITPCVFVPYYTDNIFDLYKEGKTLADAIHSQLMKRGRQWQNTYALNNRKEASNFFTPCSYRDHYHNFRTNILVADAKPENIDAEKILLDDAYYRFMVDYGQQIQGLTSALWEKEYIKRG